jgi:DNA repair ATPase RecN
MSDQSDSDFASSNKIEKAGQDILQSLQKAADVAEASRETARRLSHQLQNAESRIAELENRIRELEAEVQLYKAKMERAKQWLRTLSLRLKNACLGNGKRGGKKAETAAVQRY